MNIKIPEQDHDSKPFLQIPVGDLVAYVAERIVEKVDEGVLLRLVPSNQRTRTKTARTVTLEQLVQDALSDDSLIARLPETTQDAIRRRVSEVYRERRMVDSERVIRRIGLPQSQSLTAMSAPLVREMATALRRSAETFEIIETTGGQANPILYLNRKMADEIDTAVVDKRTTSILGDITQFNKDNGWGKLKINGGTKIVNFSIPSDKLPMMRQVLIENMRKDQVNLLAYIVRDASGELTRLIAVAVLPTPDK